MDGKIGNDSVGTIKMCSLSKIPYGWMECDGKVISRIDYSELFTKFNTQLYDDNPSHTLLSRYGIGDGNTTFNLPDYRECALVGIGTNDTSSFSNHDSYTLGQFKNDLVKSHTHEYSNSINISGKVGGLVSQGSNGAYSDGDLFWTKDRDIRGSFSSSTGDQIVAVNINVTKSFNGTTESNNINATVNRGKRIGILCLIKVL